VFDGTGAFHHGARWNSPGKRIIYAAETYAGALLEILARTRVGAVPRTHVFVEIALTEDLSMEIAAGVPEWNGADMVNSRRFGDAWFDERRSLLLFVPSLVTSGIERNVLINQEHPEFGRIQVAPSRPVQWDARLFR
jgi:RES domain-containing protein